MDSATTLFYGAADLLTAHSLYRLNEYTKDIPYFPQFPGTSPPAQDLRGFSRDTTAILMLLGGIRVGRALQAKYGLPEEVVRTQKEIGEIEKRYAEQPELVEIELAGRALEEAVKFEGLKEFDQMGAAFDRAYKHLLKAGDKHKAGQAVLKEAYAYLRQAVMRDPSYWEKVIDPAQKALKHFEEAKDIEGAASAAEILAEAYSKNGNLKNAVETYEKAYDYNLKTDLPSKFEEAASIKRQQGEAYLKLGESGSLTSDYGESNPAYINAAKAFDQATEHLVYLYERTKDRLLLRPFAEAAFSEGEAWSRIEGIEAARNAIRAFGQAENVYKARNDAFRAPDHWGSGRGNQPIRKSIDLENAEIAKDNKYFAALKLGRALKTKANEVSDPTEARALRDEAAHCFRKVIDNFIYRRSKAHDSPSIAYVNYELAETLSENGKYAEAIEHYNRAMESYARAGDVENAAIVAARSGYRFLQTVKDRVYCDESSVPPGLLDALSEASRMWQEKGDMNSAVYAKDLQARIKTATGEYREAIPLYNEALGLCEDVRFSDPLFQRNIAQTQLLVSVEDALAEMRRQNGVKN